MRVWNHNTEALFYVDALQLSQADGTVIPISSVWLTLQLGVPAAPISSQTKCHARYFVADARLPTYGNSSFKHRSLEDLESTNPGLIATLIAASKGENCHDRNR